jgi:DNA modification methylase
VEINKVYNDNAFNILKSMSDNSVDFVLTDIPYLISRKTNFKSIKNYTKKQGETEYSCMDFGEWDKEFDVKKYIEECCRILKPSRSIVVWSAWQQLKEIDDYIKECLKNKAGSPRIGIWEKSNPSVFNMDKMALQPYEFFIWNRKGSNWTFNNQRGKYIDDKEQKEQFLRDIFTNIAV